MENELIFEWDENKNQKNIEKHKIDFNDIMQVFYDKDRLDLLDNKHSQDEERRIVIGMIDKVLFVVYTKRNENIRIISARIANKKERRQYDDSKSKSK